ncbi:MAG: hypothetical protein ABJA66_17565 [Actinomycetota bacterium]
MVYIDIPFVPENNRIAKERTIKELTALEISESAKYEAFEAIYNLRPRGVSFADDDLSQAVLLERALAKLGVPYIQTEESKYLKYEK